MIRPYSVALAVLFVASVPLYLVAGGVLTSFWWAVPFGCASVPALVLCVKESYRRLQEKHVRRAAPVRCPGCGRVLDRVPFLLAAYCPTCRAEYRVERISG